MTKLFFVSILEIKRASINLSQTQAFVPSDLSSANKFLSTCLLLEKTWPRPKSRKARLINLRKASRRSSHFQGAYRPSEIGLMFSFPTSASRVAMSAAGTSAARQPAAHVVAATKKRSTGLDIQAANFARAYEIFEAISSVRACGAFGPMKFTHQRRVFLKGGAPART